MVATGKGATIGILFRNAEAIEVMRKVDTLVVDKTGTLTEGRPKVVAVRPASGLDEAQVLKLAASVERGSEHPLAAAILATAAERKLQLLPASDFDSPAGRGVTGTVAGQKIVLGNAHFLAELNIDTSSLSREAEYLRGDGATAIFLAVDGNTVGVIAVADPIKQTTPEALRALAADRIRVVMLTGDNRTTAQAVARQLGISEVEAEVLPDQKSAVVEKLRREGRAVAMAGDGVNDAPALAAAEVGIAMGTGSDVAIESAGVTLLNRESAAIGQVLEMDAVINLPLSGRNFILGKQYSIADMAAYRRSNGSKTWPHITSSTCSNFNALAIARSSLDWRHFHCRWPRALPSAWFSATAGLARS
jgi:Cu+-exporting ATPase